MSRSARSLVPPGHPAWWRLRLSSGRVLHSRVKPNLSGNQLERGTAMKFRHAYIPIVLSVIVLSPASAAPAPACPSPAITTPAAAFTSSPPATIRLAQRPSPGGGERAGSPQITPAPPSPPSDESPPPPQSHQAPTPEEEEEEASSTPGNCAAQEDAQDELRLRTMASQASLQLLRDYSAALDDAWETTREKGITSGAVDLVALAPGWPLGTPIYNKIMGKIENTMTKTMINAGIKSVEKKLLKDPTLRGVLEQIAGPEGARPGTPSKLENDLAKAYIQQSLATLYGAEAAGTIIKTVSILSTFRDAIEGVQKMEAFRILRKKTEEHITLLQTKRHEEFEMWETAKEAMSLCQDRVSKGLPPEPDEYNWVQTRNYLGLDGAENSSGAEE